MVLRLFCLSSKTTKYNLSTKLLTSTGKDSVALVIQKSTSERKDLFLK